MTGSFPNVDRPADHRVVGTKARRIEDPALLRGKGRFLNDISLPGELHAAFVRSHHAHALAHGVMFLFRAFVMDLEFGHSMSSEIA